MEDSIGLMLHLKRIVNPFEWERCHITGAYIRYGEFYYEDDEDGLVVSFDYYNQLKKEKREAEWDYSRLSQAESEQEYDTIMQEKTREFLSQGLLDRKIAGKDDR